MQEIIVNTSIKTDYKSVKNYFKSSKNYCKSATTNCKDKKLLQEYKRLLKRQEDKNIITTSTKSTMQETQEKQLRVIKTFINLICLLSNLLFLSSILIVFVVVGIEAAFGTCCGGAESSTLLLSYLRVFKAARHKIWTFFKLVFDFFTSLEVGNCFVLYCFDVITNASFCLSYLFYRPFAQSIQISSISTLMS